MTYRDDRDCKVYQGTITKIDGDFALVRTPAGEQRCGRWFAKGLGEGTVVAVHRGVIALEMTPEMVKLVDGTSRQGQRSKSRS